MSKQKQSRVDLHGKKIEALTRIIQQVMKDTGVQVVSIVKLKNLVTYLERKEGVLMEQLEAIKKYRSEYGVDY